jgi:hypothetical protein
VGADEFSFEYWLTILKKQFDYLFEVGEKLIDGRPLRVDTGPTRNMPYKQVCIRIALDYGCEGAHNARYELAEPKNTSFIDRRARRSHPPAGFSSSPARERLVHSSNDRGESVLSLRWQRPQVVFSDEIETMLAPVA